MRAIDLYSGVGGWSLGLSLAGIDVVGSYERFEPANETNRRNNGHAANNVDIRTFDLDVLPSDIQLVVGSPPCTQFSYSNRGGAGDLKDGLKDIARFLAIVEHVKPRFWMMENVPRVAAVLEKELKKGGALERFRRLRPEIRIVNMEKFGLPQRRKRCIAGNIDFDLLDSYAESVRPLTLGAVVEALRGEVVTDPIYGTEFLRKNLTDHLAEEPLDEEEERVNRSAKMTHPVYNAMSFPDPLDRSVRTITATCTRVSRESVVIADPERPGTFRRLTLRERACLQGFPLGFQFFGSSHGQKGTMIGNAVPPLFSFYAAQACLGTPSHEVVKPELAIHRFLGAEEAAPRTNVETAGRRYPEGRTFRFSIPHLNFKSGVRFDLTNRKDGVSPRWNVAFYFGHSTSIQQLLLDAQTHRVLMDALPAEFQECLKPKIESLRRTVASADIRRMQDVWTRRRPGLTRPFDFLDELGHAGLSVAEDLAELPDAAANSALARVIFNQFGEAGLKLPGLGKLQRHSRTILAGLVVGTVVNECIEPFNPARQRTRRQAVA